MRLHEISHPTIRKITAEPKGFWFRHQSPLWLSELRPLTYTELTDARPGYPIRDRKDTEKEYHRLTGQSDDTSFLYATVVGYHKMPDPLEYMGYTYYFKLSDDQISQCVFEVADQREWMDPKQGKVGLEKALSIWNKHSDEMKSYDDPEIGQIDPRVEVVIPFSINPSMYIPQIEDR